MHRHTLPSGVALILAFLAVAGPAGRAAEPSDPARRGPATRPAPADTQPATRPEPLGPGDSVRRLAVDGRNRSYLVHVPPGYDARRPVPVVLAFHGAFMNAAMMVPFCGLNQKADDGGFVVVYPNGTGIGQGMLFFNAFAAPGPHGPPDDVAFTAAVLDDLATVVTVDPRRVFATGMSNGGMMCHRLAAELSDRIAAVAPVSGTLTIPAVHPKRPVSVIMFHGTADTIVPFVGSGAGNRGNAGGLGFRGVDDTVKAWLDADGCTGDPKVTDYPDAAKDGTTARRKTWGPGREGAGVVLVTIEGGGHTWPGRQAAPKFLGKSTSNLSANDLIWEFFEKHPMKWGNGMGKQGR